MPRAVHYVERLPHHPLLGRHVEHDPQSLRYEFDTSDLTIASVEHVRALPILDQGSVGACTAFAGFGVLGTAPYYTTGTAGSVAKAFGSFDAAGAYRLYSAEESLDGDGPYPPQDQGSTGLTLAKVLRSAGLISGWTQTFSLNAALKALQVYPLAAGTVWLNSMFDPSSEGVLTVDFASGVAGGHEYEVVGYDAGRALVKIANSWGTGWGKAGFGLVSAEDFGKLLAEQGDVTVFTPANEPPPDPTPDPTDKADRALAAALRHNDWAVRRHFGNADQVAHTGSQWLTAHDL